MDITSGRIEGKSLNDSPAALPNNVYGSVQAAPLPDSLVRLFATAGWRVRKSTWTDYEVGCAWAEIEFGCDERVRTFSGVIEPDHLPELIETLTNLGVSGTIELHGPDGRIRRGLLTP